KWYICKFFFLFKNLYFFHINDFLVYRSLS
ncbi:MAG: hypothetical protein ACI86L_001085, partial [Dokdonia sp.]